MKRAILILISLGILAIIGLSLIAGKVFLSPADDINNGLGCSFNFDSSDGLRYSPDEESQVVSCEGESGSNSRPAPSGQDGCPNPDGDCPDCPPVYVIGVNGVNTNTKDSAFYRWLWENTPAGFIRKPFDLYNNFCEGCISNPSEQAEEHIQEYINSIRAANPCAKIVVVGHSLGATAAWYLENVDCSVLIDPPIDCDPAGGIFCPAMHDICESVDGGITSHPGYIDTDNHNPFSNPEENCEDLNEIRNKLKDCYESVAPLCPSLSDLDYCAVE